MRCSTTRLVVALAAACVVVPAADAFSAPPTRIQRFKSSSGRTIIEYYAYSSGPCGGPTSCNFRGFITVPAGFPEAEVFLSGVRLEAGVQADRVSQIAATVNRFRYDSATGALEVGVTASLVTQSRQAFSYVATFVVILTQPGVASYSPISTGCAGVASCRITRSLPAAVPAGMTYIGLATQNWNLGAAGDIPLNAVSGHLDGIQINPPSVDVEYLCVMQDARARNRMFCEWGAKVIAFDPAEMEPHGSPIFPQYTFVGMNTPNRHAWVNHSPSPSHTPIAGFLDAFEGLSLWYGAGIQNPIWLVDSSAGNFAISVTAPDTALTEYGIFLGTAFGNQVSAAHYSFQGSRAFGFLK